MTDRWTICTFFSFSFSLVTGVFISLFLDSKGGFRWSIQGALFVWMHLLFFLTCLGFLFCAVFYIFILIVLRKVVDTRSGGGGFLSFSCAV